MYTFPFEFHLVYRIMNSLQNGIQTCSNLSILSMDNSTSRLELMKNFTFLLAQLSPYISRLLFITHSSNFQPTLSIYSTTTLPSFILFHSHYIHFFPHLHKIVPLRSFFTFNDQTRYLFKPTSPIRTNT